MSPRDQRQSDTNRLLSEARGCSAAERDRLIDQVVVLNIEVAHSIASRFRNRGVPDDDLRQVACLALVRAAQRFDPDKAEDFLTFATPCIRGELKRYFRDQGWIVRPPRRVQETQSALLTSGLDLDRPAEELAERLDLGLADVEEALEARGCYSAASLDAPVAGSDLHSRADSLPADDRDQEAAEARLILQTLTSELAPRERLILYLRYVEDLTQQEIGDEIGVTQMQVSRLLTKILTTMRTRLQPPPSGRAA